MKKNNVMISLTSIQWTDVEKCETKLMTHAILSKNKGKYIISYEDTKATGFEGSITTITVEKSRNVSIIRVGNINSILSLEIGRKHYCQYGTPYGNMQIGVYTHSIDNKLSKSGMLYLKYSLDLNSSHLSDNEIIMTVQN